MVMRSTWQLFAVFFKVGITCKSLEPRLFVTLILTAILSSFDGEFETMRKQRHPIHPDLAA